MHRPQEWAFVEFSENDYNCRNIEFVGRHAVKLIFLAEVQYNLQNEAYTSDLMELTDPKYCLEEQDCADLLTILERTDVFKDVKIRIIENVPVLSKNCTSRPCFRVRLQVSIPISTDAANKYIYVTTINENMRVTVKHPETFSDTINEKICF